jgi:hypothetical protein
MGAGGGRPLTIPKALGLDRLLHRRERSDTRLPELDFTDELSLS